MNKNREWKIKQIIPAQPGWKAVHCAEMQNGQVVMFNRAIICWALVEMPDGPEKVRTRVRGMEQGCDDLNVVDDAIEAEAIGPDGMASNQYFLGYDDPDSHHESAYWIAEANRRLNSEKKQREN